MSFPCFLRGLYLELKCNPQTSIVYCLSKFFFDKAIEPDELNEYFGSALFSVSILDEFTRISQIRINNLFSKKINLTG